MAHKLTPACKGLSLTKHRFTCLLLVLRRMAKCKIGRQSVMMTFKGVSWIKKILRNFPNILLSEVSFPKRERRSWHFRGWSILRIVRKWALWVLLPRALYCGSFLLKQVNILSTPTADLRKTRSGSCAILPTKLLVSDLKWRRFVDIYLACLQARLFEVRAYRTYEHRARIVLSG